MTEETETTEPQVPPMRVYLSGPLFAEEHFPLHLSAAQELRDSGYEVYSPAEQMLEYYSRELDGATVADDERDDLIVKHAVAGGREPLIKDDVKVLIDCQAVALLEDWKTDRGAKAEHSVASRMVMVVAPWEHFLAEEKHEERSIFSRRRVYQCAVCGDAFTRGPGRPPAVLLCKVHAGSRVARPRVSGRPPKELRVIEPPDRTGTGYEERMAKFWAFVRERQAIYIRRASGAPPPWTTDELLATRRFPNVYKENDPGTIAFHAYVDKRAEEMEVTATDVAFWTFAYRMFNHEEVLERRGLPRRDIAEVVDWISQLMEDERAGIEVQPATHRGQSFGRAKAALVGAAMDFAVAEQETAEEAWDYVRQFFGVGQFYAVQVVGDLLQSPFSPWEPDSYMPATVLGSGKSLRYISTGDIQSSKTVTREEFANDLVFLYRELHDSQEEIDGPPLTWVNLEGALCEFSKYVNGLADPAHARLRLFDQGGSGRSPRLRAKPFGASNPRPRR